MSVDIRMAICSDAGSTPADSISQQKLIVIGVIFTVTMGFLFILWTNMIKKQ